MQRSLICALAGAVLSLACSGNVPEEDEHAGPSQTSASLKTERLHHFTAGDHEISFYEVDLGDEKTVLMQEVGSARRALLKDRLTEEFGTLTLLEVFYAIAPGDLVPAPQLVEQHTLEVRRIGRDDDSVRRASIDLDAPLDKISVGTCYDNSFPELSDDYYWNGIAQKTYQTGFQWVCLDNNCGYWTTWPTVGNVCNHSNTNIWAAVDADFGSRWYRAGEVPSLGVEQQAGWVMGYTANNHRWAGCGSCGEAHPLPPPSDARARRSQRCTARAAPACGKQPRASCPKEDATEQLPTKLARGACCGLARRG